MPFSSSDLGLVISGVMATDEGDNVYVLILCYNGLGWAPVRFLGSA